MLQAILFYGCLIVFLGLVVNAIRTDIKKSNIPNGASNGGSSNNEPGDPGKPNIE